MPTHHQGPAEEVRALDAFIKLARAAGSVLARTHRLLAEDGLTAGQFGVLETLYHLGPLHQCALARKHLQSGGNITMIVDNLERAGLVRRERLAEDRRFVTVHLTDAGRERIGAVFPRHARQIAAEMAALTAAEQEELGRLCRKLGLAENLKIQDPSFKKEPREKGEGGAENAAGDDRELLCDGSSDLPSA